MYENMDEQAQAEYDVEYAQLVEDVKQAQRDLKQRLRSYYKRFGALQTRACMLEPKYNTHEGAGESTAAAAMRCGVAEAEMDQMPLYDVTEAVCVFLKEAQRTL